MNLLVHQKTGFTAEDRIPVHKLVRVQRVTIQFEITD